MLDAILRPDAYEDGSDEVADDEHHQCHQANDEQSFAQGLVLRGPVIRNGCAGPRSLQSQGQQLNDKEPPNHCLGLHLPQPARTSALFDWSRSQAVTLPRLESEQMQHSYRLQCLIIFQDGIVSDQSKMEGLGKDILPGGCALG